MKKSYKMIKTTLYSQKLIYEYMLLIKKKYQNLKVNSNKTDSSYTN